MDFSESTLCRHHGKSSPNQSVCGWQTCPTPCCILLAATGDFSHTRNAAPAAGPGGIRRRRSHLVRSSRHYRWDNARQFVPEQIYKCRAFSPHCSFHTCCCCPEASVEHKTILQNLLSSKDPSWINEVMSNLGRRHSVGRLWSVRK